MPTREKWIEALTTIRNLRLDSSQQLADRVNQHAGSREFSGETKHAEPLSQFQNPRDIQLTSSDLLLAIGRMTTPRLENLVDLSSTWAQVRYIWAFSPFVDDFRLSEEAEKIDFHQKGLFSDEIGVGMASLIVERFMGGLNPIDVDIALRGQMISGLSRRYDTMPDYIFTKEDGSYIVVECKGTRCGRAVSISQLRRGLEQVPSLVFPTNQSPLEVVCGTNITSNNSEVFIIDPPPGKSGNKKSRSYSIKDEQLFRDDVQNTQFANLYLFSGATRQAIELSPQPETKRKLKENLPDRDTPPDRQVIDYLDEEFLGTSYRVQLPGLSEEIKIFQGVSERVFQNLELRNTAGWIREGGLLFTRTKEISLNNHENRQSPHYQEYQSSVVVDRNHDAARVDVFGQDGSMLRIEIS